MTSRRHIHLHIILMSLINTSFFCNSLTLPYAGRQEKSVETIQKGCVIQKGHIICRKNTFPYILSYFRSYSRVFV